MARSAYQPTPDPERCRVSLQSVGDVAEADGGWVFTALAQAYGVVNDRLMIFRPGSGAKTIRERVPAGRVKIHDGHPWSPNSDTVAGKVLSAEETREGVKYTGFLSSTERDLATKVAEGVFDENSLELYVLREEQDEVPIEDVPMIARRWVNLTADGLAKVRAVQEWMWLAIGLVGASSQGIRSVIDPPRLVPYQDLPLASRTTQWDPEGARQRVAQWAGAECFGAGSQSARMSRAFLARAGGGSDFLGQIADVVDGRLVVVPAALEAAAEQVEGLIETDPHTAAAASRVIGRYEQRLLTSAPPFAHPGKRAANETNDQTSGAPTQSPAAVTSEATNVALTSQAAAGPVEPPTDKAGSHAADRESPELFASDEDREQALRELLTSSATIGLPEPGAAKHEPTSPGERAT